MIKKFALILVISLFALKGIAQHDTLVTKNNERIPCKILEIGEDEIKYKKASNPEGPTYAQHKNKLREMIFANGTREVITQDEMAVDNKSTPELLNETRSFKIEPFSPFMNHLCLGYEQMLKMGTNGEVKMGYIYDGLNTNYRPGNSYGGMTRTYGVGGYLKGGVKFLLGQDFVMRGLRYAHPLKGRYVRFDVDFVSIHRSGVTRYVYNYGAGSQMISTNMTSTSGGVFISYGRQFVLGEILTLDYYIGIGAAAQNTKYSNPLYANNGAYAYRDYSYFYYAHTMLGNTFATTFGLSIGYIAKGKTKTVEPKKVLPAPARQR
jgi:hypothetical protein